MITYVCEKCRTSFSVDSGGTPPLCFRCQEPMTEEYNWTASPAAADIASPFTAASCYAGDAPLRDEEWLDTIARDALKYVPDAQKTKLFFWKGGLYEVELATGHVFFHQGATAEGFQDFVDTVNRVLKQREAGDVSQEP